MTIPVFETRCLSSLTKVFADEDLMAAALERGTALRNEVFSFQVAYRSKGLMNNLRVRVHAEIPDSITIRRVGLVPSEYPAKEDHDDDVLRTAPGLYPDPLFPIDEEEGVHALPAQWRSIWVTVNPNAQHLPSGIYSIRISFESSEGDLLSESIFELDIIPALLPAQKLLHLEWLHFDCLATQYRVLVFSERHWEILEQYVRVAVSYGINIMLTPIFTPPLDTKVGGERPTVQLVDVTKEGDRYRFGFDNLERWVELCNRNGVSHFAFSHLFTQWGAAHAPKIIASVNGREERIFGWETDAAGAEYRSFLNQFLPELNDYIHSNGLESRCFFQISDEPEPGHIDAYRSAKEAVVGHLHAYPLRDALSDYSYYEQGLVEYPIPPNDHIEQFLENGATNLWTYYCNAQHKQVANRFFNMPSSRNRIIGLQLFKFDLTGFVHWGYNFWYTQYSVKEMNPYLVTDAGCAFPSGDSFLVYPGDDGTPISSLRFEVLREALQDLRALQLLEGLTGKDYVVAFLEEGLDKPITFSVYPRGEVWLLGFRERLNLAIRNFLAQPGEGSEG